MIVSLLPIQQMYILIVWSGHAVPSLCFQQRKDARNIAVSWLLGDPPPPENGDLDWNQPSAKRVTEQSREENGGGVLANYFKRKDKLL